MFRGTFRPVPGTSSQKKKMDTANSARKNLFGAKRKHEDWKQQETSESPLKYLKIDESSSDDEPACAEDNSSLVQYERVTSDAGDENIDAISEYTDSDSDSPSNDIPDDEYPATCLNSRNTRFSAKITQYTTPTKQRDGRETSESPEKTPVLKRRSRNIELEINEYASPAKVAATSSSSEEETSFPTFDFTDEADSIETIMPMRKLTEKRWYTRPIYHTDDTITLSLIVVRCHSMEDTEGRLEGSLVWALCFDVTFLCERYIMFVEKPNRKVATGICLRLFPPWLASRMPKQDVDVIYCADLYQIILPNLMNISQERIQEIRTSRSTIYKSFMKNLPGNTVSDFLEFIPQVQHHIQTVRKQTNLYRVNVNIDAIVWMVVETRKGLKVVVKDCDLVFAIIEIDEKWAEQEIPLNSFVKFENLSYGTRIADPFTPLFSVLRRLGSTQETFYRFRWKAETFLTKLDTYPIPLPEIPESATRVFL